MYPEYAENIIVAVVWRGKYYWYVTDKMIWFLDYSAWGKAFDPCAEDDAEDRFNIVIVDKAHEEEFIQNLEPYQLTTEELRDFMELCETRDELLDFAVSLWVDFDRHHFISYFPEPASFEAFVPAGWTSEYRLFDEELPPEIKFWIDKDGNSIYERKCREWDIRESAAGFSETKDSLRE